MFEDSLVESTGRIRTRSRHFVIGSFALQAALVATLALIPYLYPATLPRQSLATLLMAPPPPAAPAPPAPHTASLRTVVPILLEGLTAPTSIPRHIAQITDAAANPPGADMTFSGSDKGNVKGAMDMLGSAPPKPLLVKPPKPSGPIRVSAGVAQGRLLAPIQPIYPEIAKSARIQGTVIVEATISKLGLIQQARVLSGPPMLAQAALQAVQRARYQPYLLNGEPVEVQTTINIVFSLE